MDVMKTTTDWFSVNVESGIAVGVGMVIQNKNSNLLTIQEATSKPGLDDYSGRLLRYCDEKEVWAGSLEVWARTSGPSTISLINVQAVPA